MKVMILCGGQGTRLREQTELRPKPMVEIGDRPILWHIMKTYAHYGFTEFILLLGYKAWVIKEYFLHYETMNSDFTVEMGKKDALHLHGTTHGEAGWKVTLAFTGESALTGARVIRGAKYLSGDEPFFLTYGDGVCDVNLHDLLAFHRKHGKAATLTGVRPPGRYGSLETDGDRVVRFTEKPPGGGGLINGGYMVLDKRFLKYLHDDDGCILEKDSIETCARDGQLHVFEHGGYWQCLDTYRDWLHLNEKWQRGEAPWKVWT
ncbi:MAG: glucose-1-phosphate cytidylyltransferase [Planctomycetota bacterium]|nr:glucose-1-phosphate cytidylyltransferase [Planctomycetota bacterium]